jgi:hypothetical protein
VKHTRRAQISQQTPEEYWFNTKTMSVEVGKQDLAIYRVGPFSSRAEAEQALQIIKERSKAWSEQDQAEDN